MSDVKQVKVDNWGIYFLQRLKHFFNRTDYCDLTLQFQDNAQLKVHRLVLSACTEYFELLERTCEMYEDCLVMPDDLQADVVVPIVNFMYTGHLEFRMDLLERLYQTSQILNMPVLSKLLESHRNTPKALGPSHSYSAVKKFSRHSDPKPSKLSTPSTSHKRSYNKAFENHIVYKEKKTHPAISKPESVNNSSYSAPSPMSVDPLITQKSGLSDPRPTRYEIPEELDTDNVFDNSFCSISYTSQPLMVHPDTVKRYSAKRTGLFSGASSSKKAPGMSTVDIVECKRITKEDHLFDDGIPEHNLNDETDIFSASYMDSVKDTNQLFDQILDHNDGPKVTIETKDSKAASNLDHARIISEVLKKYPHLVKSNKSIKLKILDPTPSKSKTHRPQKQSPTYETPLKLKSELDSEFTYETDVLDSKQAAKLIALGAENTKGPWICLICGTPGKALHFPSYFKFRRHLVEVHNEKPVSNICEYCGLRSLKRNYLLHHLYSQHGVQPPPQYNFPKCNQCSYIALTEGLLVKHKMTHKDIKYFRCNVCSTSFASSKQLLTHIQNTGHKYSSEKKTNLQCIYCMKVFLRESNLYAHIKTHHKKEAKNDCIIEDSDEEKIEIEVPRAKGTQSFIKYEPSTSYDNEYEDVDFQYPIPQRTIVDVQPVSRKPQHVISNSKQKILNPGFDIPKPVQKAKISKTNQNRKHTMNNDLYQDVKLPLPAINQEDEIVVIDNNEYIMRDNQLIPRKRKAGSRDFIMPDMVGSASIQTVQQPTTSVDFTNIQNTSIDENLQHQPSMIIKKSGNINQPIQIVVSNEEEYKALMASNHPIIFDNGDNNKTLTVLTAQHHTMDTTGIDLNNTHSNDMMIIPNEYPLNVNEPVSSENSNIVVVYSHPVDDQNKQFQILTTGGLGAQFVQSSAIITQNYETVTTSTPIMTAHCIEAQVEQPWQNNIQNINQQIQLTSERVVQNITKTDHIEIKPVHKTTNLDELPEVHLVPEPRNILPPVVCISDTIPNQSDIVNMGHLDQPAEQPIVKKPRNVPEAPIDFNAASESVITKITLTNIEPEDTHIESESMPDILSNIENINVIDETMQSENVIEQPIETGNVIEQPIETENVVEQPIGTENIIEEPIVAGNEIEQPMETENVTEQPIESDNIIEQPIESDNIIEQPIESDNIIEEPIESDNIIEQPIESDNIIEEPIELDNIMEQPEQPMVTESIIEQPEQLRENENIIEQSEQPMETEIENDADPKQDHTLDSIDTTKNLEVTETEDLDTENQQLTVNKDLEIEDQLREPMESQAYDDIVTINSITNEEPIEPEYAKADEKIQNLTSEWSEDEYDVVEENHNPINEKLQNEVLQNQDLNEEPELEESIENIQQEMKKQMISAQEVNVGIEKGVSSALQNDTISPELQLAPLLESPVHIVRNPQAQQKISSLLNDWEENDCQEEMITVANIVEASSDENTINTPQLTEVPIEFPKNDNIKSLVSDWDDEDEESKE